MFLPVCKDVTMLENFRHTFTDKKGEKLIIRLADKDDYGLILSMYDLFEPKESAQGLPPADSERRKNWVRKILEESLNVISETGPTVVGHACLIDIQPGVRSELIVAVHQDWQGRGLGSAMISLLVEVARRCNYHRIWLTVNATNLKAIHVYKKYGFTFVGPFDSEREMELALK
jgi:RimJ/RimL family protein N-acetyltransferase